MRRRFARGSGVYTCRVCHRRTRDTQGEAGCELCRNCYNLGGLENQVNDSADRRAEAGLVADEVASEISDLERRGGDASHWRAIFARMPS